MLGKARNRRLDLFTPLPHQAKFFELGLTKLERALLAGNQLGKSIGVGGEVAMHLTGRYGRNWCGRRFSGPTRWWAAGDTIEACRDNPQRVLLGHNLDELLGTGLIPKSLIGKVSRKQIPDAADRALIRHVSGGWSVVTFKSYDQGRKKWQGATLHGIWFDEEPPEDVYTEGLARLTATRGMAVLAFTPLEGMTKVVEYFFPQPNTSNRALVQVGIEDAGLYSEQLIREKLDSYPSWEREARAHGIPMQGKGLVLTVAESMYRIPVPQEGFPIPRTWPTVIGMDFGGGEHATAAARVSVDKAHDIVYLHREYKGIDGGLVVHAAGIKAMGGDRVPVVWPHDGHTLADRTGRNEQTVADLYRKQGLRMWNTHATHPDGGFGLDASVKDLFDRMRTGRFKVLSTCTNFFEEARRYHMKQVNGKVQIVRIYDDLLSATMKALMMIRVARPEEDPTEVKRRLNPTNPVAGWDPFASISGRKAFT